MTTSNVDSVNIAKIPNNVYTVNIFRYHAAMSDKDQKRAQRDLKRAEGSALRESVPRGAYHHKDLRATLIREGRKLLVQEGIGNFSLRRLAQRLNVSHAAPYRHFASREELLSALVEEASRDFQTALIKGVSTCPESDGGEDRLMLLGEAYVRFYLENPEILGLFSVLPAQLAGSGAAMQQLFAHFASPPVGTPSTWEDPGLVILRETARPVLQRFPGLGEKDILLGYWAKVHGLACILSVQPDWFAPEDLWTGLRRVIRASF